MILNEDQPAVKFYTKLLMTLQACVLENKNDPITSLTTTWHLEWEEQAIMAIVLLRKSLIFTKAEIHERGSGQELKLLSSLQAW